MAVLTLNTAKYSQDTRKYRQNTAKNSKISHKTVRKVAKMPEYGEPIKGLGQKCPKWVSQGVYPEGVPEVSDWPNTPNIQA